MKVFSAISKEILAQFVVQVVVISAIVMILQMTRRAESLFSLGISFENILTPFLLVFLPFAGYVLPIAFLFACMVAFLRFSTDQELTALRAAGMSLWSASAPVVVLGFFISTVGIYSTAYLDPWSRVQFQKFFYEQAQTQLDQFLKVQLQPKVFSDGFFGISFYAEEINQNHTEFKNIILGSERNNPKSQVAIFAKRGDLSGSVAEGNLVLNLYDGTSHHYSSPQDQTSISEFSSSHLGLLSLFKDSYIKPKFNDDDFEYFQPQKLKSFYTFQKSKLLAFENAGQNTDAKYQSTLRDYNQARFLYIHRFTVSLCVIGLGLLGMVFGIQGQRGARNLAYAHTVSTFILSYGLIVFCRQLGSKGTLSPYVAALLPIVMITGIAVVFLYLKNKKAPSEPLLK